MPKRHEILLPDGEKGTDLFLLVSQEVKARK